MECNTIIFLWEWLWQFTEENPIWILSGESQPCEPALDRPRLLVGWRKIPHMPKLILHFFQHTHTHASECLWWVPLFHYGTLDHELQIVCVWSNASLCRYADISGYRQKTKPTVLLMIINIISIMSCLTCALGFWHTQAYAVFQWCIWHQHTHLKSLRGTLTPDMRLRQRVETWPQCLRARPQRITNTTQSGKNQLWRGLWIICSILSICLDGNTLSVIQFS